MIVNYCHHLKIHTIMTLIPYTGVNTAAAGGGAGGEFTAQSNISQCQSEL